MAAMPQPGAGASMSPLPVLPCCHPACLQLLCRSSGSSSTQKALRLRAACEAGNGAAGQFRLPLYVGYDSALTFARGIELAEQQRASLGKAAAPLREGCRCPPSARGSHRHPLEGVPLVRDAIGLQFSENICHLLSQKRHLLKKIHF